MSLESRVTQFMQEYPHPSMYGSGLPDWKNGSDEWHGMCAQFCWRLADWLGWEPEPSSPYNTAAVVASRSGNLNTRAAAAPIGAWHFWAGGDGHVALDVRGGGLWCAEGYRNPEVMVGVNSGFDSISSINQKLWDSSRMRYIGWATNYAGGKINSSAFAGGGSRPIGDDMNLTDTVTTGSGTASVNDYFFYTYRDVKAANTKLDALTAAVSALAVGAGLDPVALGKSLAAAVDAALADDFASLATKITQSIGTYTPAELAAIAKAVQDEEDKRERARLGA